MKIIAYLPLFGSVSVHPKVFKSFVDMLMEPVEGCQIEPFIHTVGPSLDYNRNDAVERILGAYDPEFIMFCDADNVQPHRVIPKLLAHMDDDIGAVSSLYFKKSFPHSSVPGHFLPWNASLEPKRKALESQGLIDTDGRQLLYYQPLRYFDVVQPVDVIGMGSVLIRSSVFKQLKQPYFRYINAYLAQDYSFGVITEDLPFCAEMKKAGVKVLCDPKVVSGHIVEKIIQGAELGVEQCVS